MTPPEDGGAPERRGYRREPTPREDEEQALAAARDRFAHGEERYRKQLERGTLSLKAVIPTLWRIALLCRRGERIAVGTASGDCVEAGLARTVAEALCRAPAEDGAPDLAPHYVGQLMRMRRNSYTPWVRTDGTLRMTVPGAEVVIGPSRMDACSPTGAVRLSLEGGWTTDGAAKLADAMLRDLAPEARHLVYTTPCGGHYRNESGSRMYDSSSWGFCSCGWSCAEGHRASARSTVKWHQEHPTLYLPPPTATG